MEILKKQNEELTKTLHEKHKENEQYYNSLQEYDKQLKTIQEKVVYLEECLKNSEQKFHQ